jgi:DNA-binding transcriptional ArsR family regulator
MKWNTDWTEQAKLLKAVAHPIRLRILAELCKSAQCVHDVQQMVQVSQPNLSQHLAALKNAELIDCHIQGPMRCYYLVKPTLVTKLLQLLSQDHPVRPRSFESVSGEVMKNRQNMAAPR